jgi:hypothetical protein
LLCLEVTRNDRHLCIAGVPDGILSGDLMGGNSVADPSQWSVTLYVGGVTGDDAIEWVREELAVGDLVTFKLIEAAAADPARPSTLHDPEWQKTGDLAWARHQYAELTRQLGELRQQYGDQLLEHGDA